MTSKLSILVATATLIAAMPVHAQMQMPMNQGQAAPAQGQSTNGTGKVNKVDPGKHSINLSHAPIPAINWPAMTMDFAVAPGVDLSSVKAGQQVEFTLVQKPGSKDYEVTRIKPAG
jgi:Cu/Ag efflux protein CusF